MYHSVSTSLGPESLQQCIQCIIQSLPHLDLRVYNNVYNISFSLYLTWTWEFTTIYTICHSVSTSLGPESLQLCIQYVIQSLPHLDLRVYNNVYNVSFSLYLTWTWEFTTMYTMCHSVSTSLGPESLKQCIQCIIQSLPHLDLRVYNNVYNMSFSIYLTWTWEFTTMYTMCHSVSISLGPESLQQCV